MVSASVMHGTAACGCRRLLHVHGQPEAHVLVPDTPGVPFPSASATNDAFMAGTAVSP